MPLQIIDPEKITNFNATDLELQHLILFWIAVAGKTARVIAPKIYDILKDSPTPFEFVQNHSQKQLETILKDKGIGCYKLKSEAMKSIAHSNFDLRTVSADELETIRGIGRKTSRCFIMHTRKDTEVAGLDTHILSYLSDMGFDVPNSTPSSKKQYELIEDIFVNLCKENKVPVAEFDLRIWNAYSSKNNKHISNLLSMNISNNLLKS